MKQDVRMDYDFREIEEKWRNKWRKDEAYKVTEDASKPKYYVLDMFPYPSGAGLHVGHPLGYIASDVFARYKRLQGFNVLHPMGYDAFGLPAEQYAIQTGQHPAVTTEANINTYRRQLDQLGFSFDWSREVRTCDPDYYKWTQWLFLKLYDSWYDKDQDKARPVADLRKLFAENGSGGVNAHGDEHDPFSADDWEAMSKHDRNKMLLNYRLAYLSEAMVNWCPELGTVLANDEVKDGVSERGGFPVEQKLMKQWSMRITAYSQRLLDGLETIDWSDSMTEMQRNWIGRSEGASVQFEVEGHEDRIEVFTTRPDTIFGATFMVLAPEHELVDRITTDAQKEAIAAYVDETSKRSERDRMADVKSVTGCDTGACAINPFTGRKMPIWIADYVLAGYGTGAIMAVPAGDDRDWRFAREFGIEIIPIIEGQDIEEGAEDDKNGVMTNSDFLNGMTATKAIPAAIAKIEEKGIGKGTINYKQRDAVFGRQRYWGEPIPIYYVDGVPYPVAEEDLPVKLPEVDKYLPTEDGEPPLARATDWNYTPSEGEGGPLETTTMPGWAGSSWYYLRYMDADNENEYVGRDKVDYWGNVDLYIGGAEHATGHLLYVRFWTKVFYDLGMIPFDEPANKLINQGMIQGVSAFAHRLKDTNRYVSAGLQGGRETTPIHVDVNMLDGDALDTDAFKAWRPEFADAEFELENGKFICSREVEKMSKSKYNVQNPDDIIDKYGADTLRLYEMFLGPLTESKPWDVKGIEGTHRFLRKLWKLYHDTNNEIAITDEDPTKDELKALHRTIKKIQDDLDRYSFNTVVSEFMICVNELADLKCTKRAILEPLAVLVSPYAPHIAEELWQRMGHDSSVMVQSYPEFDEANLVEDSFEYPVSFNGKTRFRIELPATLTPDEVEKEVLAHADAQKWLEGQAPKKVIVVPKRIVNVVV